MNITVYRGRTFADSTRPLRYIDLDQLAQPVAQITPGSVVSADFTGTAINLKLGYIGGAGIGAQHTSPPANGRGSIGGDPSSAIRHWTYCSPAIVQCGWIT